MAEEKENITPQSAPVSAEEQLSERIRQLKESVSDEDAPITGSRTLRNILGGDVLWMFMRQQVWLFALIVLFTILYVAFRYQGQRDFITIDRLQKELLDAKYKALDSSSKLTEQSRESRVMDQLKNNKDSVLHVPDQPPYIINIEEHE